jgi:glyoxylase-like metal-dependent hydrolase (beta-lactamase superfamily II)
MTRISETRWLPLLSLTLASALVSCASNQASPAAKEPSVAPPAAEPVASTDARSFAIGDAVAIALRDGALEFPNDNAVFGVGRTPEEVAALLRAEGLPTDKLQLGLAPLLVKGAGKVLLFDTGAGANFGPAGGRLPASLASAGVDPGSVTDIFISHAHGDHLGGLLGADGQLFFPRATIHLSANEWRFLRELDAEKAKTLGLPGYAALVPAITPRLREFAPGAELVPGFVRAVDIKGHTPGHSGYLIGSGPSSVLYFGDAAHHFVVSVQKPEWNIAFDGDAATSAASRRALIEKSAADGQRVYGVHFPFPGIGKFTQRGDHFVFAAE